MPQADGFADVEEGNRAKTLENPNDKRTVFSRSQTHVHGTGEQEGSGT